MSALADSFRKEFEALPASLVDAQGLGETRRASLAAALADGLQARAARAG